MNLGGLSLIASNWSGMLLGIVSKWVSDRGEERIRACLGFEQELNLLFQWLYGS